LTELEQFRLGCAEFGMEKHIQTLPQGLEGNRLFFSAHNREHGSELLNDDITCNIERKI